MDYNFSVENADSSLSPFLLVHGWGGTINSLSSLQHCLAKDSKHPVYNLELPGFGKTEISKDSFSTSDYASFISGFIDSKKLKNVVLIGHSFGGKSSIALVVDGTPNIERLILINSSGLKPNNTIKKNISKIISNSIPEKIKTNSDIQKFVYKYILRESDYLNAGKLKTTLSKVVEEHYDDKLGAINIPTLIIWAEHDTYVPVWMGYKLKKDILNSKLIVVPDSTHGLPLHKPEIVSQIITSWV